MNEVTTQHLAFLDIETTGFSPNRHHKILEVAIITTDNNGNILEEYETLINANRDIDNSHIHGIIPEMIKDAPLIEEAIIDIANNLNNKIIVGHNISFDLNFINHELKRNLDISIDVNKSSICTLQLSRELNKNLPFYNLEMLCKYYNIKNPYSHSAYGDSFATIELFKKLNNNNKVTKEPVYFNNLPPKRNLIFKREKSINKLTHKHDKMINLINRLPIDTTQNIPTQEYLILLNEILADRIITDDEIDELNNFAKENNISQTQIFELHKKYLKDLIKLYLQDNFISDNEFSDLLLVSELLLIPIELLESLIEEKGKTKNDLIEINKEKYYNKSICFTGKLSAIVDSKQVDRNTAQKIAFEKGMIIKNGVTKDLDYLVTADPNSLSGKAKKARSYGTKIISENVFWNMLGISID